MHWRQKQGYVDGERVSESAHLEMEECEGSVWAELESLNPIFGSKTVLRRGTLYGIERFTIGRSKNCQLHFDDDPLISQIHCCLLAELSTRQGGDAGRRAHLAVKVQDSSRNGTFVNGTRVGMGKSVAVHDGDIISLVVAPEQRADGSYALPQQTHSESKGWAQLQFGDGSKPVVLAQAADTPFVIGSHAAKCSPCGLAVTDEWVAASGLKGSRVSSAHCHICLSSELVSPGRGKVLLTDTSTNGTWLNFTKLERGDSRPLRHGDLIKLVNPAAPEHQCPDHLYFTFHDTRPLAWKAYRLRLKAVQVSDADLGRGPNGLSHDAGVQLAEDSSGEPRAGTLEETGGRAEIDQVEWDKNARGETLSYADAFREIRPLGGGTYGSVKECVHVPTGREVAVKKMDLRRLRFMSLNGLEKVRTEMRIHGELRHVNVVRCYHAFETRDFCYLVMELVKGGDLFDFLAGMPVEEVSEDRARHMFRQMVEGVGYLHSNDIVHRDLKPENVMLVDASVANPTVKLTDFGEAKSLAGGSLCRTLIGTEATMAPEVFLLGSRGRNKKGGKGGQDCGAGVDAVDGKIADVWGLGVILYVMLAQFYPLSSAEADVYRDQASVCVQRVHVCTNARRRSSAVYACMLTPACSRAIGRRCDNWALVKSSGRIFSSMKYGGPSLVSSSRCWSGMGASSLPACAVCGRLRGRVSAFQVRLLSQASVRCANNRAAHRWFAATATL